MESGRFMLEFQWDDRRTIIVPGDYSMTLQFCADHFMKCYKESIQKQDFFSVALSGGSTPKALFSLLTSPPFSLKIDWSKIYLFWSDERAVSPTHPDSNFLMAMEAGFNKMPIPQNHIHRMKAEKDIEKEALAYELLIQKTLKEKSFDLIMLGMGEDGHTASLFPNTEGLKSKNRLVIANYIPQKQAWRMTLTFECINASPNTAIYVLGENKQQIIHSVLHSTNNFYPIEQVGSKEHKALWIIDEAAAKLLVSHF